MERVGRVPAKDLNNVSFEIISTEATQIKQEFIWQFKRLLEEDQKSTTKP
jgi:hypothetical protein